MLIANGRTPYTQIGALVEFAGARHIVSVGELAAIENRELRTPVGSLDQYEDVIRRALDKLFTGF
jgi:hypothetical protein